jgi:RNA polymerase sigma-70 factor (ECF subfamily)
VNEVEKEIIDLIRNDDDRALELIYDNYSSMIYGVIYMKCRNRAESDDLLQKVFIKIVDKREKLAFTKHLKSYICRLAINEVNDYFRRKQKKLDTQKYQLHQEQKSVFNTTQLEVDSLKKALLDLPEDQNQVVMMKVFQNFTFKDIGHLLGISANTAASRYRYALSNLRKSVVRSDEDE